jgi:hypothetical protein
MTASLLAEFAIPYRPIARTSLVLPVPRAVVIAAETRCETSEDSLLV